MIKLTPLCVVQLCMVFRTWAQICKLDRQHEGSLPPYAFALMTIFFLQKHKYLPVLHEVAFPLRTMRRDFDPSVRRILC